MRYFQIAALALLVSACHSHPHPPMPPVDGGPMAHAPLPPLRPGEKMVSAGNLSTVAIEAPANTSQAALDKALYKVAALDTVRAGYDKFEVVDGSSWYKGGADAAKMEAFKNKNMKGMEPSATMNIRMFRYDDAGSENAIDARSYAPVEKTGVEVVKKTAEAAKKRK